MHRSYSINNPNRLYFRKYGEGPCIVLFHPSPNSSVLLDGLASSLSDQFTVLCPDTPGYGFSEQMEVKDPSMTDYVNYFKEWLDQLGIKKCSIYGSATGGQLAIRFGIEHPDMINNLYLDNCAHFTDEERSEIMKHYFPDLEPRLDGSHLITIWDIVSNLFKYFPWCFKEEQYQLNGPMPPPDILHMITMDYLAAGKDYDIAYRAAFDHEKVDHIKKLEVPTKILRWEASILKKYTDRIFEYDLPPNVVGKEVPADRANRYDNIKQIILDTEKLFMGEEAMLSDNLEEFTIQDEALELPADSPPTPDLNGNYLLQSWHWLKDIYQNNEGDDSLNSQERANRIQLYLIRWYQNNKPIYSA